MDSRKFTEWSGAEITDKCGTLITGKSLHFTGNGKRMLVTGNMDLITARYSKLLLLVLDKTGDFKTVYRVERSLTSVVCLSQKRVFTL